jgi:hypothetical protein
MADNPVERLGKYIPLPNEDLRLGTIPRISSTLPAATRAENLAAGEGRDTEPYMRDAAIDVESGRGLRPKQRENVDKQLQKIGELADQYKRETRGKKDTSLRGKIRDLTGMKSGGKVSSASSRADGCCVKGKTKGRYI